MKNGGVGASEQEFVAAGSDVPVGMAQSQTAAQKLATKRCSRILRLKKRDSDGILVSLDDLDGVSCSQLNQMLKECADGGEAGLVVREEVEK